jgi:hypothetical protein
LNFFELVYSWQLKGRRLTGWQLTGRRPFAERFSPTVATVGFVMVLYTVGFSFPSVNRGKSASTPTNVSAKRWLPLESIGKQIDEYSTDILLLFLTKFTL